MESSPPQNSPEWDTRQIVRATLYVVSILVLFFLLYRFSNVVIIFLISIILSTGIRPIITRLSRYGLPRAGSVILLYLFILFLVGLFLVYTFPFIVEQITNISRDFPTYYGNLHSALLQSSSRILTQIGNQLPPAGWMLVENFTGGAVDQSNQAAPSVNYVGLITRSVFILTSILFLCFYWTLDGERSIRSMLLWVPSNRRDQIREFIAEVEDRLGGFILGQGILCLFIGVMALVAYSLMGLPYALILAIIAGIMEAVPIVGPVLGAVPALLVAFTFDPTKMIWVILIVLLIQGLENYLLVPRVMKRSVGVNPLVVLLTIAAFTSLFGLAGAVLSIPVAAVIQLTIDRFVVRPTTEDIYVSDGRGQVSVLRYEANNIVQDLRKQMQQSDQMVTSPDHVVDSLEAIARDLDLLLAEAEQGKRTE